MYYIGDYTWNSSITNWTILKEIKTHVLADCFSRLPRMDNKITVGKKELEMNEKQKGTLVDFKLLKVPSNKSSDDEVYINLTTTATSKDWSYDRSITTNNRDTRGIQYQSI